MSKSICLYGFLSKNKFKLNIEFDKSFQFHEEKELFSFSINVFFSLNDNKLKNFYVPIYLEMDQVDYINTYYLFNFITEKDCVNIIKQYLVIEEKILNQINKNLKINELEEDFFSIIEHINYNQSGDFIHYHNKKELNFNFIREYLISKQRIWDNSYIKNLNNYIELVNEKNIDEVLKEHSIEIKNNKFLEQAQQEIEEFKLNYIVNNVNIIDNIENINYQTFFEDLKNRFNYFYCFYSIYNTFKGIFNFKKQFKTLEKIF